jgi:hypothetical protein
LRRHVYCQALEQNTNLLYHSTYKHPDYHHTHCENHTTELFRQTS